VGILVALYQQPTPSLHFILGFCAITLKILNGQTVTDLY
jgi:hypothetical protein